MDESSSKNYIWISIGILIIVGVLVVIGITRTNTTTDSDQTPLVIDPTLQTATTSEQPLPENNNGEKTKIMQTATLTTTMGDIVIKLDNTNTPNTVNNFTKLAGEGFYNETKFHRVIAGFMIQGGDPLSKQPFSMNNRWGTGGPGYQFADEIKPTNNNIRGTIAMANSGPDTNGSQFFINVADNTFLNPKHTVFGTVIKGMDVVDAIVNTKTNEGDQPLVDIAIKKITLE
mgnify:CR=1 FL=1